MPIYEYQCGACGHQFEEWQQISDPPVDRCPECNKRKVERLMSVTSFQLKGGGWYADGYASKQGGSSSSSDSSSSTTAKPAKTKKATKAEKAA